MSSEATFVYVVYIGTTLDQAWQALTQGDVTRQYWGHENVSDWRKGSGWEHRRAPDGLVRVVGKVLEVDPPRRLVLSWAEPKHGQDPKQTSRVSFELEPVGNMIRLTVTHDQLEAGSKMLESISKGWPRVLSSLKSYLELGKPLDTWAGDR